MSRRMQRPKHIFTPAEDMIIRERYKRFGNRQLANDLGIRLEQLWARAHRLGLTGQIHLTPGQRRQVKAFIRAKHKLGWTDAEMSRVWCREHPERPLERRSLAEYRRGLGLPHNAYSEFRRRQIAAKTREQLDRKGLASLAMERTEAFKRFARDHGWPDDLRPRAVMILDALFQHGPMTRRQIAEKVGMPWKGSKKTMVSNDPSGTYLSELERRGMVVKLGRRVKSGPKKGAHCNLYSLALDVAPRRSA